MVRNNEHMFNKMNITLLEFQILIFLARHPNGQCYIREIAQKINNIAQKKPGDKSVSEALSQLRQEEDK